MDFETYLFNKWSQALLCKSLQGFISLWIMLNLAKKKHSSALRYLMEVEPFLGVANDNP